MEMGTDPQVVRDSLAAQRDTVRAFYRIWGDATHGRHQQYKTKIGPRLWACRCRADESNHRDRYPNKLTPEEYAVFGRHCPRFHARYDLIGFIGAGSFGAVFLAESKVPTPDDRPEYFAVKFQETPVGNIYQSTDQAQRAVVNLDISRPEFKNIKVVHPLLPEILIEGCVGDHTASVCEIVEVFHHSPVVITVLPLLGIEPSVILDEAAVSREISRRKRDPSRNYIPMYTAGRLHKTSPLDEVQIRRVAHCVLQAIHHMFDLGCTHNDLAARNLVLEHDLKACVIDFSYAQIHPTHSDFYAKKPHFQNLPHRQCPLPEVSQRELNNGELFDLRHHDLWRLGMLIYENVCSSLKPDQSSNSAVGPVVNPDGDLDLYRLKNYPYQMMKRPLRPTEELSQELVDLLQVMFNLIPSERPTVEELATFPWFSGAQEDFEIDWQNPNPGDYVKIAYSYQSGEYRTDEMPRPGYRPRYKMEAVLWDFKDVEQELAR